MTPRFLAIAWFLIALLIGLVSGAYIANDGRTCETHTHDGGLTYIETCTREVSP